MTAKDAVELCALVQPRTAIAIHYEGWKHFREGREAIERGFAKARRTSAGAFGGSPSAPKATRIQLGNNRLKTAGTPIDSRSDRDSLRRKAITLPLRRQVTAMDDQQKRHLVGPVASGA